ncbi:hypothetical protein B4065_1189 [Caldibacillus thermoamylovorans]|nr:hypothetical protein B4065_1189 [Caldibacillus thermoamylovorans]
MPTLPPLTPLTGCIVGMVKALTIHPEDNVNSLSGHALVNV